jgi:hypothetical protein
MRVVVAAWTDVTLSVAPNGSGVQRIFRLLKSAPATPLFRETTVPSCVFLPIDWGRIPRHTGMVPPRVVPSISVTEI